MASIYGWMEVFCCGILCGFFLNILSFKYFHRKYSQGFKSGEIGGHKNSSSNSTGYRFGRTVLENVAQKVKCGIAGVSSGTILSKPGWVHCNNRSHQEMDKVFAQQTEVDIKSDCTINEHGTEQSDGR
jgi:hypothetical protein